MNQIKNIAPSEQVYAEIAVAVGWTELAELTPSQNLYGVPPEKYPGRKVSDKIGLKYRVPPIEEMIENIQPGPAMDALVGEVLGLEVLGIAKCVPDYEGIGYDIPDNWEGSIPRPVYLRGCICAFKRADDIDYFGHVAGCLAVVKEFSLEDSYAFEIVDWLVEQGYSAIVETRHPTVSYCDICKLKDREHLASFEKSVGWGRGKTRPLAICRALLNFFVQR